MKKRHGNYNKRATKKQTTAQKRNFSIFRLRGILVSLGNIEESGELTNDVAKERVHIASDYVLAALQWETGK